MSTFDNTRGLRTSPTGLFAGLTDRVARYRVYRTTLTELSGLNDRELTDLGIHRSSIRSIAYKAAYSG